MGLKFRRSIGEHLYLSGQAPSAITGGAGAYSVGLIELGATLRFAPYTLWSAGAEAIVWVGRDLGRYSRIKVGAGYVKSLRGGLSSPVVDLTWAAEFGAP